MKNTMEENSLPFVSVIIPTYNRGYIIEESIKSILNQTHIFFEIIVVDDQSTDNTREIIEAIGDNRIVYHCLSEKLGAAGARQKGIEIAKYEYISFHDSDDFAFNNKIEKELEYLLNNGFDVVACKFEENNNGQISIVPSIDITEEFLNNIDNIVLKNFIGTPLLLGKKSVFEVERFDSNYKTLEDWELAIRLVLHYKVGFLNEILYKATIQENSLSKQKLSIRYYSNRLMCKYFRYVKFKSKLKIINNISLNFISICKQLIINSMRNL